MKTFGAAVGGLMGMICAGFLQSCGGGTAAHLDPNLINPWGLGEGGMIAGWSPAVDPTHAVTMYSDAGGAVYKGLAVAPNNGALFLYATEPFGLR